MERHARTFGALLASLVLVVGAEAFPRVPGPSRTGKPAEEPGVTVLPLTSIGQAADVTLPLPADIKAPPVQEYASPPPPSLNDVSTVPPATLPSDVIVQPFPFPHPPEGAAFAVEVDYLWWRYPGQSLPPLVASGNPLDSVPGALGQPNTQVLVGGADRGDEWTTGMRVRVAGRMSPDGLGWELGGLVTAPTDQRTFIYSSNVPVLARPFFDTVPNAESAFLVGFPGAFGGDVAVHTRTTFWGLEANATATLDPCGQTTGFVGFRYLRQTDELEVSGRYTVGPNGLSFINGVGLLPGAVGLVIDQVTTKNEFCGGQVGARHRFQCGKIGCDVRASLAIGTTNQQLEVAGRTYTVDADGTARSARAGLLAQASNSGQFGRDRLTVIPEAGVKLFFAVSPKLSVHAGYDVLYWPSVLRAGAQVDRSVDTRQSPTSPNLVPGFVGVTGSRPVVPLQDSEFWAQGVNVGLRFEY